MHEALGTDPAIANVDYPVGMASNARIVGHHYDRYTKGLVHLPHQAKNLVCHLGVQLAGGFVGQEERRMVGQGHADGYALLFTA